MSPPTTVTPMSAVFVAASFCQYVLFVVTFVVAVYSWRTLHLIYLSNTPEQRPELRSFLHPVDLDASRTTVEAPLSRAANVLGDAEDGAILREDVLLQRSAPSAKEARPVQGQVR